MNSLSDEKDKWWGCFRSGDGATGKTESVRERDGNGEWSDERLKVTDVSCLASSDMISSLPVFQMHRHWMTSIQ